MSRRRAAIKREVLPDPKFKDKIITKFMNGIMLDGKKSKAEKIIYGAFEIINKNITKKGARIPICFAENIRGRTK